MSKLKDAILAGQSIKGLKGFLKLDGYEYSDGVYIPIRIVGTIIDGCSLTIEAEAPGGIGTLKISPCQFIDTLKDAEKLDDIAKRKKQAMKQINKINRFSTVAGRRRELLAYVETLNKKQRKDYDSELTDLATPVEKLSDFQLKQLTKVACNGAFGVLDVEDDED